MLPYYMECSALLYCTSRLMVVDVELKISRATTDSLCEAISHFLWDHFSSNCSSPDITETTMLLWNPHMHIVAHKHHTGILTLSIIRCLSYEL